MFIWGIGTAAPSASYSQAQCWEAIQHSPQFPGLANRSKAILRKVLLGNNAIHTRRLALDSLGEAFELTPDALHARFLRHAPELGVAAALQALRDAEISVHEIDALLVSTCTGYLCPGLSSYIAEKLELRADVFSLDLVGQGCGAALPNLRTARELLAAGNCRKTLSICVEVCSAAFYLDDDPGVLVSACLFGDGAAAVVSAGEPKTNRRPLQWLDFASRLDPGSRDLLRFEQRGGMLRNLLALEVPMLAGKAVPEIFESLSVRTGLSRESISAWIFHAGGRDVLLELERAFRLSSEAVPWSWNVLRDFGNVSSPSVLFALEEARRTAPDGNWFLSSFGAGFTCHGAILKAG
jgi:polyketide synthase Type III